MRQPLTRALPGAYPRALVGAALAASILLTSAACSSDRGRAVPPTPPPPQDVASAFPEVDASKPQTIYAEAAQNLRHVDAVRIQTTGATGADVPADLVLDQHGLYLKGAEFGHPYEAIVIDQRDGYMRAGQEFWQAAGLTATRAAQVADLWIRDDTIADKSKGRASYLAVLSNKLQDARGTGNAEIRFTTLGEQPVLEAHGAGGDVTFAGDPLLPAQLRVNSSGVTTLVTFSYDGVEPVAAPDHAVDLTALTRGARTP